MEDSGISRKTSCLEICELRCDILFSDMVFIMLYIEAGVTYICFKSVYPCVMEGYVLLITVRIGYCSE